MSAGLVGRLARWLEATAEPAASAPHRFGRSDMTVVWRRLRVPAGVVVVVAGLLLGTMWQSLRLFGVAALAAGLSLENWWQLRRRSQSALLAVGLDTTLFAVALVLLGVSPFVWAVPFLYSAVTARMLLSWGRALVIWGYDLLLVGLLFASRLMLPDLFTGPKQTVIALVVIGIYMSMVLVEVAVLGSVVDYGHRRREQELEALVAAKDTFVATISHELRTPLTSVVGFASLLEERLGTRVAAEDGEMLRLLREQAQAMWGLVDDLLVKARIDSGFMQVRIAEVDLGEVASQTIKALTWIHPEKPITLVGELGGRALADPTRVAQILRNLLANATRYGGEPITVEIRESEAWTSLTVRDNGPGIPEHLAHRFQQPLQTTHPGGYPTSLGLGLWLCDRLARLMGGSLEYSRVDNTTAFTVNLPSSRVPPDLQTHQGKSTHPPETALPVSPVTRRAKAPVPN